MYNNSLELQNSCLNILPVCGMEELPDTLKYDPQSNKEYEKLRFIEV